MGESDRAERIAAKCAQCGKIYTAQLWLDGSITPVGKPSGCRCGGTDFVDLTGVGDEEKSRMDGSGTNR